MSAKERGIYQPLLTDSDRNNSNAPEDSASIFSKWFLFYLDPLFSLGVKKELVLEDLGGPSQQDRTRRLYDAFYLHWQSAMERKRNTKKNISLWHVLWQTVGYDKLFHAVFLYFLYAIVSYGPVLILSELVSYFEGTIDLTPLQLWAFAVLMFLLPILAALLATRSNMVIVHISTQFRNALVNMTFRKALRLSPASRQSQTTGKIINLFANDTKQIQNFLNFANNLLVAPFQIGVTLYLIYREVGVATFVGLAYMLLIAPLNSVIFGYMTKIRFKKVAETDKRVKLMNEILAGIRVIKYYAWEVAFKKKINEVRTKEVKYLRIIAYCVAFGFSLFIFATPIILPILIFYTYVRLGNQLDAATAFTTIALFNMLQMPFAFLPMGLVSYAQSAISINRLRTFFESDEMDEYVDRSPRAKELIGNQHEAVVVSFAEASLGWAPLSSAEAEGTPSITKSPLAESDVENRPSVNRSIHTLTGLNVSISKGQLVAVVGAVGSGKSSFIGALLGNMYLHEGSVEVRGSIAFCDQTPWILNSTVEGNILFGAQKNQLRFDLAVKAACLDEDLKILPAGINTEIGERGINLSGGQKARVSLARAIYMNSDIYLLDDPLAAVDAHVGQSIFQGCIKEALADKTRILVTHHIHLLSECDLIIVLENGSIKASGTYQELGRSGIDLSTILPPVAAVEAEDPAAALETPVDDEEDVAEDEDGDSVIIDRYREASFDKTPVVGLPPSTLRSLSRSGSVSESVPRKGSISTTPSTSLVPKSPASLTKKKAASVGAGAAAAAPSGALMTTEERSTGDVSSDIYWFYIRSGGLCIAIWFLFFLALVQGFSLGANFYLTYWGSQSINQEDHGHEMSSETNIKYMQVFAALSLAGVLCTIFRGFCLAQIQLTASLKLHKGVLDSILGAPVAFFDVTPLGRIVNRFSSDMTTIDETIAQSISQMTNTLFSVFGALVGIAVATNGTFLLIMVPLAFVYNHIQRVFRKTNTAIARLEAISRSPIYAYFSETLNGVNTIRAYGEEKSFIERMEAAVDANTAPTVLQWQVGSWLGLRLDFIGSFITFFVVALSICCNLYLSSLTGSDFISAGYLALGLTYSFTLTQALKFCVRVIAQVEANMNSVERLKFYSEQIEQEGTFSGDGDGAGAGASRVTTWVADSWPLQGKIEAQGLQMRYRDGPLVLKGVNFLVEAGEKVGIAGRTGSGKSSLMNALFRIQELAGGKMFIGGVDTATIPLHTLRSRIGMVPQDPVLFSATVRFNLDPFDLHTDDEIWSVLEQVDMQRHVSSLPNMLQENVVEGGENFSAGQRQLMCIGRALLRKPKILVLDEATASIDNETDELIQRMVRQVFKNCTVLTIAHRLHTIIDCDKIMVLDSGLLAEMDSPEALLNKEGGLFKSLWERHQKSHQH